MSQDDAFEAGYDAYWDGGDPEDYPFKADTPERRTWDEGWAQAEMEDEGGEEE